jgi:Rod binding domain-containing protein
MSLAALSSPALGLPQDLATQAAGQAPTPGVKDKKAAQQFEGMLMANLFQCLRKTVNHSTLFGDSSSAQGTYEYLLDQAVVNHAMTAGKGWGLADRLQASWDLQSAKK